jgi:murein DD-endopeptidase MepM/ murein hydrolase activator NlpD
MTVTVEPGQTLSRIALDHHVPMQAIADANHLSPPYRIIAGATLVIPGAGAVATLGPPGVAPPPPTAGPPPVAVAALPPPKPPQPLPPPPTEATPPRHVTALEPRAPGAASDRSIPLDRPSSSPIAKPKPAPPPAQSESLSPPPVDSHAATPSPAPANSAAPVPPHAPAAPHEKSVAAASPPPAPARGNSTFLWPVRGHVLEGFGSGPGGTHNDGVNIAAPRGAPVEAADGGIVAYAGNELRGYGNLILVKHPNGWITAYAHCDMMLVKPGQKVTKGQVIARVGSTGNVGEPQLHFELRRGNKPVDPREYLSPLPTAARKNADPG